VFAILFRICTCQTRHHIVQKIIHSIFVAIVQKNNKFAKCGATVFSDPQHRRSDPGWPKAVKWIEGKSP